MEEQTRPYSRWVSWLLMALALLILSAWLIGTPGGPLGKADAVGYAICHRMPQRSFHIHHRAMPLCARCTGIYLGVMTAVAVYAGSGRLKAGRIPPLRVLAVLIVFGLAIAIDGFNSYFTLFPGYHPLYHPNNTFRLITGVYAGITMLTIVQIAFSTSVWSYPDMQPAIRSMKELLALCMVGALVIAAVMIKVPVLLYVFGLISAAGVVLMFMLIGTVLFITITGHGNTMLHWRDLALPAVAGLIFALFIIGFFDAGRYALTGTWDGFNLERR
jgi:uncharacterized membrane protein